MPRRGTPRTAGHASRPGRRALRAGAHRDGNREDRAIEALVEQICAIDGCTRDVALRQILAFEKACSEL